MVKRIGIFSGLFDPVHKGHIGFALSALREASLDEVYLLVETKPRRKKGVTHVAHRIAMAKLATAHYPKLHVLELPDQQFSVAKTLPRLKKRFEGSDIYFMCGSDMLEHMPQWPLAGRLLQDVGMIVAIRQGSSRPAVDRLVQQLPVLSKDLKVITSLYPEVSSGQIRQAVRQKARAEGLLGSTQKYAREHWLYSVIPIES